MSYLASRLNPKDIRLKYNITNIIVMSVFALILIKLFTLQIIKGQYYQELAQKNSTLTAVYSNAPRGIIYDRNNKVLASNKQYNNLMIIPKVFFEHTENNQPEIYKFLQQVLKLNNKEFLAKISKLKSHDLRPRKLIEDLSLEQVVLLQENSYRLPGLFIQSQATRFYVYGKMLAHIVGYTGKVSEKEYKNKKYNINDVIGKFGIEKTFDNTLRGYSIDKQLKINRYGQPIEAFNYDSLDEDRKLIPGNNLNLTIDIDLQKVAYEALGKKKGAVVLVKPANGEVLAIATTPSFDPNLFTSAISHKDWNRIQRQKLFLNRAISNYPPGSIWKPLVTLTALDKKVVDRDTRFYVGGAYYLNGYKFGDWTKKKAVMTIQKALAWSRDTAFYKMADYKQKKHITVHDINDKAKKLELNKHTGLELNDEKRGLIPDKKFIKTALRGTWHPGSTLHYSIGQGYLLQTPAQAARMVSFFANNGKLPKLHLVHKINNKKAYHEQNLSKNIKVNEDSMKIVKEGMTQCTDSGTCQAAKFFSIESAGKTGSAENPHGKKTHAWYVAYAPTDKPEIAIAVFAENAGHGGSISAPIAKKVMTAYFEKYHPILIAREKDEERLYWKRYNAYQAKLRARANAQRQRQLAAQRKAQEQQAQEINNISE